MDPTNILAKFEVRSFTRSWDLHCNVSSIFTHFRDIVAFVLQHATFSPLHL